MPHVMTRADTLRRFCLLTLTGVLLLAGVAARGASPAEETDRPARQAARQPKRWDVTALTPECGSPYPADTMRITYRSAVDGAEDWALFLPGDPRKNTIVYLHGSFSYADQIFTRTDLRAFWLTRIQEGRHPLLSVNLRGTAYMSPAATADLTDLLRYCRDELGCRRFVLLGGSGGASSAMAYAVLHPENLHGVIAMGMCDLVSRLDFARRSGNPLLQKLAQTVFDAYGGTPAEKPDLYRARSVLAHAERLTMPVILTMGENDQLIPVAETRKIAAAMQGKSNFVYHEIPHGDHDAALWVDIDLETLRIRDGATSVPEDVAFCREVLILHHSHVDIGYTHPQSMYWELQKGYLDAALDMLDRTETWPDDLSRPRWTAEVTAPVVRWLQTTADVARLKRHIQSGRFGISGFEYNATPLSSSEGLARQLYHVRTLREQLGADIRTVHQHDVTGLPWGAVDLLLDSRIECLVMGINLHLSGTPMPRPAVYRWRGPSGRELLVLNGEHYSMFDQWCNTSSRDLETIQAGLFKYLRHVRSLDYPYDFVYLSATHAPYMYDNSPPNQDLPGIVRQWNEAGRHPRLRLVTPNELLARLQQIPRDAIPVVSGDWTDYWNFGSASSAAETGLARKLAANTAAIDLLRTWNPPDSHTDAAVERLWSNLNLYNEHTWGAHNSLDADNPSVVTQWYLKAYPAYDGKPLSDFQLRRELQRLAGNPWQSWETPGVLVVNPTGLRQDYHVPGTWKRDGKQIESHFLGVEREATARPLDKLYGPIPLEPFSWQIIPWSQLAPAPASGAIQAGPDFIESDHYKLSFDPAVGKVVGLLDKRAARQVVAPDSPWGFFQLVHERPANGQRSAFHVRSVEGERYGRTGWKPDWQATRTSYTNAVTCSVEKHARSATLIIRGAAEGVSGLEQRITLHADSPLIDLSARFLKADIRSPEAIYFAFPLHLPAGWRAHFDTAGAATELDAEQIPGSCRDWVTVETFASMHQPDFGVTLYCPDAPLVQFGNFHWAKKQDAIPRDANPLLLAWPLNNYWETNFRASQPGVISLRYSFTSHASFDPTRAVLQGQQTCNPPVTHLVLDDATPRRGRFLDVYGDNVVATYVKPADDRQGIIARLVNLDHKPATAKLTLPGHALAEAWLCGTLEDKLVQLPLAHGVAVCELQPRQITTIRLVRK